MTAYRIRIHVGARDPEAIRDVLRRLTHQEAYIGIGQAAHDGDHRHEELLGIHGEERRRLGAESLRRCHPREEHHHLVVVEQRRTRQRIDAAGEHDVRTPFANVGDGRVDRLHPRGAVAHHGPCGDLVAAAETQRRDAANVDLICRRVRAAENHLAELFRRDRLPQQQCTTGGDREIGCRKRPRRIARLEEWRSCAVDDVDGCVAHAALASDRG